MRPQPATLDGLTRAPGGVLADGTAPQRGGRRFSAGSKVPERSGVGATHASAITTPASEERQAHSERVRARGSRNSHPGPPVGAGFGRRKTATNPNKDNNSGQPRAQRESAVGVGLSLYGKKDRQKDGGQPRSSKVQQAPRTCCAPFPLSLPSPYACPVALTCCSVRRLDRLPFAKGPPQEALGPAPTSAPLATLRRPTRLVPHTCHCRRVRWWELELAKPGRAQLRHHRAAGPAPVRAAPTRAPPWAWRERAWPLALWVLSTPQAHANTAPRKPEEHLS